MLLTNVPGMQKPELPHIQEKKTVGTPMPKAAPATGLPAITGMEMQLSC